MLTQKKYLTPLLALALFASCEQSTEEESLPSAYVDYIMINGEKALKGVEIDQIDTENGLHIEIIFSCDVDADRFDASQIYIADAGASHISCSVSSDGRRLQLNSDIHLPALTPYSIVCKSGNNLGVKLTEEFGCRFVTALDTTPKFPAITEDELLTTVQERTFRYFWDYANPASGLVRDRFSQPAIASSGATGFGLMAILVGAERGFITHAQALERCEKTVNFLNSNCQKYHGAFAHYLDATTGASLTIIANDDGGDLVQTAFLMQGLLAVRQYFSGADAQETALRNTITDLWEGVDWNWFRKAGENQLYWHWSPNKDWIIDQLISGWNEGLITYILAAASPTHSIEKAVYDHGWARDGYMKSGKNYYGYPLPLGSNKGGPLYYEHHSFMGLNPTHLVDKYATYWQQVQNHTLINYAYCVANPGRYHYYSEKCWGLTTSDGDQGPSVFCPSNDKGVIAPTAALSSMPYTPEQSLAALNFFYYILGDKLLGECGFFDAFNLTANWIDNDYQAMNQGPIIVMLENYRSRFMWNLFMSIDEVKEGLTKLGFTY